MNANAITATKMLVITIASVTRNNWFRPRGTGRATIRGPSIETPGVASVDLEGLLSGMAKLTERFAPRSGGAFRF